MEFYKDNLKILFCDNANDDKLIIISLGKNIKFQNKTKIDEKKLPTITYNSNIIHLFGDVFVKNNQKRILLIKDNKLIKLRKSVEVKNQIGIFQIKLKIKLKIMDHLLSMKNMFQGNLFSVKYLSKINTRNVKNMSGLFSTNMLYNHCLIYQYGIQITLQI